MFADTKVEDLVLNFNMTGFGPQSNQSKDSEFDGKLFKPYNKKERVSRLSEYNLMPPQIGYNQPTKSAQAQQIRQEKQASLNTELVEATDDVGFTTVSESSKNIKQTAAQKQQKQQQRNPRQQKPAMQGQGQKPAQTQQPGYNSNFGGPTQTKKKAKWAASQYKAMQQPTSTQAWKRGLKELSYEILPDWTALEEFSKQFFDKLPGLKPAFLGVESEAGQIHAYDFSWDKVKISKPRKLPNFEGEIFDVPMNQDEYIAEIAKEGKANVFMSDKVAAAIMTATKPNFSWDVKIQKLGKFIFIDKREEENILDFQTVYETSQTNMPMDEDSVQGVRKLMREAGKINNNWMYQCQKKDKFEEKELEDPFMEDEDQVCLKQGYFYKLWQLSADITVCIRCSVHSYYENGNESVYQNVFALTEWLPARQKWEQTLDIQTAVCLSKEISENTAKVTRWTVQSMLGEVQKMKFAFVQRADSKAEQHKVAATYQIETKDFAKQINLNMGNCWAVLRSVIESIKQQQEGKSDYLFIRDYHQPVYKLYKITTPLAEIDDDEDEEQDEL